MTADARSTFVGGAARQGVAAPSKASIRARSDQQHAAQKRIDELAYSDAPYRSAPTASPAVTEGGCGHSAARPGGRGSPSCSSTSTGSRSSTIRLTPFGDKVLQLVTERLQTCLRQTDMLCRIGGDEFAMYLHAGDTAGAEQAARRMLDVMRRPFTLDGMGFSIQCSIGVGPVSAGRPFTGRTDQAGGHRHVPVKERGRGSFGFISLK